MEGILERRRRNGDYRGGTDYSGIGGIGADIPHPVDLYCKQLVYKDYKQYKPLLAHERSMNSAGGYLTVFLALILSLIIMVSLGLIEGVRHNAVALESECVADVAWNSVFAEYHRGMAERFNIFVLDASYGTDYSAHSNIERHYKKYLDRNVRVTDGGIWDYLIVDFVKLNVSESQVNKAMLLTDGNGRVYRAMAVNAVKDDLNLHTLDKVMGWLDVIQGNGLLEWNSEQPRQEAQAQIGLLLKETEGRESQSFESPTAYLDEVRKRGILSWVLGDNALAVVSNKTLLEEELFSARSNKNGINKGNVDLPETGFLEETAERFLFREYLLSYFGNYLEQQENSSLQYQIEYLIVGKPGDADNLREVIKRITAIREAANAMYLFSDAEKSQTAEVAAFLLSTVVGLPELTQPVKVLLLLGWSYGETLHDMELLLEGQQVPLLKDDRTWHYSLDNILEGIGKDKEIEKVAGDGMHYKDYLRVLMMLTGQKELTKRSMDLTEADIRLLPGNSNFCLDNCYVELEAETEFTSDFGYTYSVTKKGSYLYLK